MSAMGIKPCIEEALQNFLKANEGDGIELSTGTLARDSI